MAQIMPMLMSLGPALFGSSAGAAAGAAADMTGAAGMGLAEGPAMAALGMGAGAPAGLGAGSAATLGPGLLGKMESALGAPLHGLWQGANSPVGQMLTKDVLVGNSSSQGGVPDLSPMQLGGGQTAAPQSAIPMPTRTPPQAVGAGGGAGAGAGSIGPQQIIALLKSLGIG